jgi:hypothetical protein
MFHHYICILMDIIKILIDIIDGNSDNSNNVMWTLRRYTINYSIALFQLKSFYIKLKIFYLALYDSDLYGSINQMGSITKIHSLEGLDFSFLQGLVT